MADVYSTPGAKLFLLSLCKPTWLPLEGLQFGAERDFCCVNIYRKTTQSLQMEIYSYFLLLVTGDKNDHFVIWNFTCGHTVTGRGGSVTVLQASSEGHSS